MHDDDRAVDTSRRDFLKKAGVAAGATAWAVPTMQLVNMAAAGAQAQPSPVVTTTQPSNTFPSYVAMNVVCTDETWFIKWEDGSGWEDDPGSVPSCENDITPFGSPTNGGNLGFTVNEIPNVGVEITIPNDCEVTDSVAKKGQNCCDFGAQAAGTTVLYFCNN